jgi:hypothetical protein
MDMPPYIVVYLLCLARVVGVFWLLENMAIKCAGGKANRQLLKTSKVACIVHRVLYLVILPYDPAAQNVTAARQRSLQKKRNTPV